MSNTDWRAWTVAWAGAAGLGVANGVVRETAYAKRVDERTAHQISTATLAAATAVYVAATDRRHPTATARHALAVGALWVAMTVGFEFGLGFARRRPWRELTADYDVARGRLWPLFLALLLILPITVRRRRVRR